MRSIAGILLIVFLIPACAHELRLEYLADQNLASGIDVGGTEFGGISALAGTGDKNNGNSFLALSDDRSEKAPARWYQTKISVTGSGDGKTPAQVILAPGRPVTMVNFDGKPFPKGSIDPEAMVVMSDGRVFVSSEGDMNQDPRIDPAVFLAADDGRVMKTLDVPQVFLPEKSGKQTRGVRNNGAFESMTVTPDGKTLLVAAELPLIQDGEIPDYSRGGLVRMVRYRLDPGGIVADGQFVYELSPVKPWPPEPNAKPHLNGLVEMFYMPSGELLAMERAGVNQADGSYRTRVRLWQVDLDGATDVSGMESLKSTGALPLRAARKRLVLDLDEILPKLSVGFQSLDNLEAIHVGPDLPDGTKTLILVSDNNFNASQRTQVLLFAVR